MPCRHNRKPPRLQPKTVLPRRTCNGLGHPFTNPPYSKKLFGIGRRKGKHVAGMGDRYLCFVPEERPTNREFFNILRSKIKPPRGFSGLTPAEVMAKPG